MCGVVLIRWGETQPIRRGWREKKRLGDEGEIEIGVQRGKRTLISLSLFFCSSFVPLNIMIGCLRHASVFFQIVSWEDLVPWIGSRLVKPRRNFEDLMHQTQSKLSQSNLISHDRPQLPTKNEFQSHGPWSNFTYTLEHIQETHKRCEQVSRVWMLPEDRLREVLTIATRLRNGRH